MAKIPGLKSDGTLDFNVSTEVDRITASETIRLLMETARPYFEYESWAKKEIGGYLERYASKFPGEAVSIEMVCSWLEHNRAGWADGLRNAVRDQAEMMRIPYLAAAHPRERPVQRTRVVDPPERQAWRFGGQCTFFGAIVVAIVAAMFGVQILAWLCVPVVAVAGIVWCSTQETNQPYTDYVPLTADEYDAKLRASETEYQWLLSFVPQLPKLQLPAIGNFEASDYEPKVDPTGGWPIVMFRLSASNGDTIAEPRDVEVRLQFLGPDQHLQGAEAVARAAKLITEAAEAEVAEMKRNIAVVC